MANIIHSDSNSNKAWSAYTVLVLGNPDTPDGFSWHATGIDTVGQGEDILVDPDLDIVHQNVLGYRETVRRLLDEAEDPSKVSPIVKGRSFRLLMSTLLLGATLGVPVRPVPTENGEQLETVAMDVDGVPVDALRLDAAWDCPVPVVPFRVARQVLGFDSVSKSRIRGVYDKAQTCKFLQTRNYLVGYHPKTGAPVMDAAIPVSMLGAYVAHVGCSVGKANSRAGVLLRGATDTAGWAQLREVVRASKVRGRPSKNTTQAKAVETALVVLANGARDIQSDADWNRSVGRASCRFDMLGGLETGNRTAFSKRMALGHFLSKGDKLPDDIDEPMDKALAQRETSDKPETGDPGSEEAAA